MRYVKGLDNELCVQYTNINNANAIHVTLPLIATFFWEIEWGHSPSHSA